MTNVETPPGALGRSVIVSASTQLVARAFDFVINAAVSITVLRHLGPTGFGDYVLVLTVVGLAGLLSDFGLPKMAVRQVARDPSSADSVIGTLTGVRILLCLLATVVAQASLAAMAASGTVRLAALVAMLMVLGEALLSVTVVFHVAVRQQNEAAVRLCANAVKLVVVLALVSSGAGLVPLVTAVTANLMVAALLAWLVAARTFGLRPSFRRALAAPLLRAAVPVGSIMLLGVLYLKLGILMMSLLTTRVELGIYAAAYQPIEYLFLMSAIVVQVLFPLASRAHAVDTAAFVRIYRLGAEVTASIMLPAAVVLFLTAGPIVELLYGEVFARAAAPLGILAVALVLMAINAWQGFVLLAAGRQVGAYLYLGAGLTAQFGLDLVLIPRMGPLGAAWACLGSAALLLILSTLVLSRLADVRLDFERLARVLVANALLAACLGTFLGLGGPWMPAVAGAAAMYPVLLGVCRVAVFQEVRSMLHRRSAPFATEMAR